MVKNPTPHDFRCYDWEPLPVCRCLSCGFTWTARDLALLQETVAGHQSQNPDCLVIFDA